MVLLLPSGLQIVIDHDDDANYHNTKKCNKTSFLWFTPKESCCVSSSISPCVSDLTEKLCVCSVYLSGVLLACLLLYFYCNTFQLFSTLSYFKIVVHRANQYLAYRSCREMIHNVVLGTIARIVFLFPES